MHNITSFLFSCDAHVCFFLAVFLSLFCICPFFFQFWSNHNSYTRIQRSRIKEKEESESYSSVKLKIRRKEEKGIFCIRCSIVLLGKFPSWFSVSFSTEHHCTLVFRFRDLCIAVGTSFCRGGDRRRSRAPVTLYHILKPLSLTFRKERKKTILYDEWNTFLWKIFSVFHTALFKNIPFIFFYALFLVVMFNVKYE